MLYIQSQTSLKAQIWLGSLICNVVLRRNKMSIEDKAKAVAKNIEGKAQELVGNITGDPKDQLEGKAKQAESQVRHGVENLKDQVKEELK